VLSNTQAVDADAPVMGDAVMCRCAIDARCTRCDAADVSKAIARYAPAFASDGLHASARTTVLYAVSVHCITSLWCCRKVRGGFKCRAESNGRESMGVVLASRAGERREDESLMWLSPFDTSAECVDDQLNDSCIWVVVYLMQCRLQSQ